MSRLSNHITTPLTSSTSSKEPGLDDVAQLGRWTFTTEHLHGVVPSHAAKRATASDEDDFTLIRTGCCVGYHVELLLKGERFELWESLWRVRIRFRSDL
jgi:hypothetical protein